MLEARGDLDLPAKALDANASRDLLRQNLDDNLSIEASLLAKEQPAHSSARELALEGVGVAECPS